jgi:hypothetical protein
VLPGFSRSHFVAKAAASRLEMDAARGLESMCSKAGMGVLLE